MRSNGITSSALNLLRILDHSRWDVSVVMGPIDDEDRRANAGGDRPTRAPVRPRRARGHEQGPLAAAAAPMRGRIERISPHGLDRVDAAFAQDWRRVVGSARFDHVVDFSGYSPGGPSCSVTRPAKTRAVWLHNDLLADQVREVEGRRPHESNLRAVFTSYARFDHLVSVSAALRDINARSLSEWAPPEKFPPPAMPSTSDGILDLAAAFYRPLGRGQGRRRRGGPGATSGKRVEIGTRGTCSSWPRSTRDVAAPSASLLSRTCSVEGPRAGSGSSGRPHAREGHSRRSSTSAVLSPAKNHARLIQGVRRGAQRAQPALSVLIIMGYGPLPSPSGAAGPGQQPRHGVLAVTPGPGSVDNPFAILAEHRRLASCCPATTRASRW